MNPRSIALLSPRVSSVISCAVVAIGVAACGGEKPVATTPADVHATAATTGPSTPAASTPTASNVSISDEIRSRCGIPDADAYFTFDSSHVTSNDHTPLDLVARCFTQGPLAGHAVKLVGRADPRGSSDYNFTLGQSRADAVGSYLDARGMAKDKTVPTSRGAMDAAGSDESGWQHDRRVDVMLAN